MKTIREEEQHERERLGIDSSLGWKGRGMDEIEQERNGEWKLRAGREWEAWKGREMDRIEEGKE